MSRLFVGNFSFEQGLNAGHNPGRLILRFESELACLWLAVSEPGDEILCPAAFPANYSKTMESLGCAPFRTISPERISETQASTIVPWGWTPAIRKLCTQSKLKTLTPSQDAVRVVNSRVFQWELCRTLGRLLPGEGIAKSLSDLMPLVQSIHELGSGWIIKPNLGQAGRGQIRGEGRFLSESQFGTVLHTFSQQEAIVVEPLLNAISELGCQWEIASDGTSELIGITTLISDDHGRYRGTMLNCVEITDEARDNLIETQQGAVKAIAEAGYFGPLGIDAMVHRDRNGEVAVRPIQDINARWTMGRIGWEWSRRLKRVTGQCGWYHGEQPPHLAALALSPEIIDGTPVRCRTWWVDQTDSPLH